MLLFLSFPCTCIALLAEDNRAKHISDSGGKRFAAGGSRLVPAKHRVRRYVIISEMFQLVLLWLKPIEFYWYGLDSCGGS